jgi:hypothetical protein
VCFLGPGFELHQREIVFKAMCNSNQFDDIPVL